jgi:hypothetical protein
LTQDAIDMSQRSRGTGRAVDASFARRRRALAVLAGVAAVCLLSTRALPDDQTAGDVEGARTALEKWVETRRILSEERREWELGREMLAARIDLVQQEIEGLRGKIGEARDSITEVDEQRTSLVEASAEYDRVAEGLVETVAGLERRARELIPRLPDPALERIALLRQRMPKESTDSQMSPSERFLTVVGLLNELDKFQREITITNEVREIPGGASAEVTAVYLGLGQAYYVDAAGRAAGVGTAGPDAWVWSPADEGASRIGEVAAILRNERAAEFVRLPIRVD